MKPLTEREIFLEALEMATPETRAAYLQAACGQDVALRRKVDELLKEHFSNDSLLAGPALDELPAVTVESPVADPAPQMVGRYKLLEKIGEGGFGEVWMAEQREPIKRRVAFKIIKPGMDSRQIVARFEAERQALAMMDHANIARIFDAGVTETGRPYFVMELVRGLKITDYCDQKQLPTRERLNLFTLVCHAIQHAHQKGIIHRDIKPSNILVTLHDGVPVPKVIDFGIAKATQQELTDKTLFTQFQQFMGTPAYISPEQAEMSGLDIDTRADIYSLGVLLYELLVGQTPFDAREMIQGGLDALRRIIREKEPLRPSTKLNTLQGDARTTAGKRRQTDVGRLVHQLQGDLDWIVMKCLEKDRTRRYDTANGLAMDIERYLKTEPVIARPPSKLYEFQKTVRRHKLGFAAAGAVVLALAAGLGIATWTLVKEKKARERATAAEREQRLQRQRAEEATGRETQQHHRAEQLAEQNRQHLYAARINQAWHVFQEGDAERVLELLNSLAPKPGESDLRGFEWYYLWRLCHSEKFNLVGHVGPVRSVAFSPDGLTLASAGNDGFIRLWDTRTGKQKPALKREVGWITSVAFSPDGKWLAAGGRNNTVSLWETATGNLRHTFKGHTSPVSVVKFSPDGRLLASGTSDPATGSGNPSTRYLGKYTTAGELKVWDLGTMTESAILPGHPRGILDLAFSPDGKMLVSGGIEWAVRIWDVSRQQELACLTNFTGPIFSLSFAPDGKTLATAGGIPHHISAEIKFWDVPGFKELSVLHEELPLAFSITFTPDGQTLVMAGKDEVIRLLDLVSGRTRATLKGHQMYIRSVAVSPDGKTLASGAWDGALKLWDATKTQETEILATGRAAPGYSLAFSPDGKLLAGGGGGLAVWDVATGQKRFTNSLAEGDVIVSISGNTLAAAGENGVVELWNLRTFEHQGSITGHVGQIWSMAFSPDSRTLTIGGRTNDLELWDFRVGVKRASLRGQRSAVSRLAFTSDGRTLVAGTENELSFWDMETLGKNKTFPTSGHGLTIAPSGRLLAAGNFAAGIKLRALPELEELVTIKGHKEEIWSLAFSPDSKTLATASWDGTVKLWHVATGQELFSFDAGGGVAWCATFSPDSRLLAFGSGSYQKEEIALVRAATEADVQQAKRDKLAGDEGVLRERLGGGRSDDPLLDGLLVLLLQNLLDQQKFADAEIVARQSLANREKNQPDKWLSFNTRSVLGGILLELKKYAEAEPFLLAGYAGLKEREDVLPAAGKACLTVSLRRLVQLYEATAQPEKAAEWKKLLASGQAKAEK